MKCVDLGSQPVSGCVLLAVFPCVVIQSLISPGSAGHVATFHPPHVKWPYSEGLLSCGRHKSNLLVPSLSAGPRQDPIPQNTHTPPHTHHGDQDHTKGVTALRFLFSSPNIGSAETPLKLPGPAWSRAQSWLLTSSSVPFSLFTPLLCLLVGRRSH